MQDGRFRSLFAVMLEQHPRGLGDAVGGPERGREDLGLHIIMSTNATVTTAPTVAMKRGDKRSHKCKIVLLADPSAILRCIASSPPLVPRKDQTVFQPHQDPILA